MDAEESIFVSTRHGFEIAKYSWQPQTKDIRGVVLLVHGVHSSAIHSFYAPSDTPETDYNPPRYEDSLVQSLVAVNFSVHAHDHLGHGKSQGHLPAYFTVDDLLHDTLQHLDELEIQATAASVPIFIVGSSLGALVTCLATLRRPGVVSGVFLCGPLLAQPQLSATGQFLHMFSPLIAWALDSKEVLRLAAPHSDMLRRYWGACPLVWKGGLRALPGHSITRAYSQLSAEIANLDCPVAILVGEHDRIVDFERVVEVLARVPVKDKEIMCVPRMGHTPFLEEGRASILQEVSGWLVERAPNVGTLPSSCDI